MNKSNKITIAQAISRLNHGGITYLHASQFEEATELFRAALSVSRRFLAFAMTSHDVAHDSNKNNMEKRIKDHHNDELDSSSRTIESFYAAEMEHCLPLLLRIAHCSRRTTAKTSSSGTYLAGQNDEDEDTLSTIMMDNNFAHSSSLYLEPIPLEEIDLIEGALSPLNFGLICTFNLAITLHTSYIFASRTTSALGDVLPISSSTNAASNITATATTSDEDDARIPLQTARLYELAYAMLSEHQEEEEEEYYKEQEEEGDDQEAAARAPSSSMHKCRYIWLMSFAILNNLGLLYKQMRSSTNDSHKIFANLLSCLLVYYQEQHQHQQNYFDNEEEEEDDNDDDGLSNGRIVDRFYSNAVAELRILSKPITAPGA